MTVPALVSLPGAPDADLAALTDCLLDLLADRVADRVCDRLRSPAEPDVWLDLNSAAEHLKIHPDTLRKRAKAGQIPYESRTGRAVACTSVDQRSISGGKTAEHPFILLTSPTRLRGRPKGAGERLPRRFHAVACPLDYK